MNTVITFPTIDKTIITQDSRVLNRGVAWVITPGSLHTEGEIYEVTAQPFMRQTPEHFYRYLISLKEHPIQRAFQFKESKPWKGQVLYWVSTDLEVPQIQRREFSDLAAQGWHRIFWIRTPAIGLGSLHLSQGGDNEPFWAQTSWTFGKGPKKSKLTK